jgi:hypothetical protein
MLDGAPTIEINTATKIVMPGAEESIYTFYLLPDRFGPYLFVKDGNEEVGCVKIDTFMGILSAFIWDHENYDEDPKIIRLDTKGKAQ